MSIETQILKRQQLYNKEMQKELLVFKEFADKNNITFWLDWGTLLGAVRDKQIIPWEQDIDLGFFEKDLAKVVSKKEEIEMLNFKLFKKLNGFALVKKGLTAKIDLYAYKLNDEYALFEEYHYNMFGRFCDLSLFILGLNSSEYKYETLLSRSLIDVLSGAARLIPFRMKLIKVTEVVFKRIGIKEYLLRKFPKQHFETLDDIMIYGKQFKIPSKAESLLESRFGSTWRTPIRWDEE